MACTIASKMLSKMYVGYDAASDAGYVVKEWGMASEIPVAKNRDDQIDILKNLIGIRSSLQAIICSVGLDDFMDGFQPLEDFEVYYR